MISFQAGSRTIDLELTTLSSTNHVELSPSDAGFQDRYIVQEIIKEMAKNRPIDTKGKKGYKGKFGLFNLSFNIMIHI
jgi:replication factor C subunit 3/5